jgi:hypothetical protein
VPELLVNATNQPVEVPLAGNIHAAGDLNEDEDIEGA